MNVERSRGKKPPLGVACLSCWLIRTFEVVYPMAHTGIGSKCPK